MSNTAEYISKEAVIKYIQTEGKEYDLGCISANRSFCEEINRLPAADVVEVVRCRDCTYAELNEDDLRDGLLLCWYCRYHGGYYESKDFCSYGTRKDGGVKSEGRTLPL